MKILNFYFRATLGVKEVLQSSKNLTSIFLMIFDSILLQHSKKTVLEETSVCLSDRPQT